MKKKWIFFILFASLAILMLARGSNPQAQPRKNPVRIQIQAGPPAGWSAPEKVSNTARESLSSYAVLDAKGNAYVSWVEWFGGVGARRDMMFNTNKSGKWETSRANSLVYPAIDDVGFPQTAVSQDGNRAIYAWMDADFSLGHMAIFAEELVNGTWSGVGNISGGGGGASTYPTIAFLPADNTFCLVWQVDVGGFNLAYRFRDGATGQWSDPALISAGQGGGQYLPNIYVDSKGTAHVVYIARMAEAIVWYTKNTNPKNLNGWTAPIAISEGTGLSWTYPMVTASDDGDAYVVWQGLVGGYEEVYFRRQINGEWQPIEILSKTPNPSENPSIAVNPSTEEVYAAWQEALGSGIYEVLMKTYEIDKATGQKKWSDNIQMTNSSLAGEPRIRITKDGDLHLFYTDNGEIMHIYKLAQRLYAPQAPTVTSQINKILFYSEKINTITFAKNSDNDDSNLASYKLYRRKAEETDEQFQLLATLNTSTFQYDDRKLPLTQKYAYALSAVDKDGNESAKTTAVTEK
jgi:hypothetical protein